MKKFIILLILLSLFVGLAGAGTPVTLTKLPTYNIGSATGAKTTGTLQAGDLYATDDLIVGDDTWNKGDMTVNGTLNSGGTATLNAVVSNTTVTAPADGIRANSVILPGEMVIRLDFSKAQITAGEINNSAVFIADDAWTITSIEEAHPVAETSATTLTVAVQKMTGTQALTGGINVTEAAFNLKAAANTVQTGTLSTTAGRTTLADGNRLGIICNMTGAQTSTQFLKGGITIHMKRV